MHLYSAFSFALRQKPNFVFSVLYTRVTSGVFIDTHTRVLAGFYQDDIQVG